MSESGPLTGDEAVRRRALDTRSSFIVQAPAGSGKTELLTRRYLALLARTAEPEEIVAITFTRKAAAEMRERVLAALRAEKGAGNVPRALARAVIARDAERGWHVLDHPARLRITTIDSLCMSLVHRMPWSSRFGAAPRITGDAASFYRQAARATLRHLESTDAAWSGAVEALLRHLDNDWPRLQGLLAELLERRDQWLRHVGGRRLDASARQAALESAWQRVAADMIEAARAAVPPELVDDILACAAFAGSAVRAAGEDDVVAPCAGMTVLPGTGPEELPRWQGIAALLLSAKKSWRQRPRNKSGFSGRGERAGAMKARMQGLLEALQGRDTLQARLSRLQALAPTHDADAHWRVLTSLFELLPLAAAELRVLFRDAGQADFTEIAQRAAAALGTSERPTDLALALDHEIRHLLVDEFQDTSYTQLDLLERLVAGWEPDDGRTVFLVGDPMQSIYRFREAEVGIFMRLAGSSLGPVPLETLVLSANFRSAAAVVEWVNGTFAGVLPAAADPLRGAVPYVCAQAVRGAQRGTGVTLHPLVGEDGVAEAQRVVELVTRLGQADGGARMAILVRNRSHLADIVPTLRRHGIRFRGVEIERLSSRPVVVDLLSLTRALLHPADRIAWLAVLRAPWCGLSLSALEVLAADARQCLWQRLCDAAVRARLDEDASVRAARTADVLMAALAQRGRRPLRRWVEGTWVALGGPACVDAAELDNADAYLELLEQWDTGGDVLDMAALTAAAEDLWAVPDAAAGDALQVMTIHKAKGLEFDVVVVPGLGRAPRSEGRRLLLWAELPNTPPESGLLLAPLAVSGAEADPRYEFLRTLEAEKSALETARLAYVGCTRATRELHLLGNVKLRADATLAAPESGSLLHHLWPAVHGAWERRGRELANAAAAPGSPSPSPSPVLGRVPATWRPPAAPAGVLLPGVPSRAIAVAASIEYSWAGAAARCVGIVVHEMLARMGRDGLAAWSVERLASVRPAWRARLESMAVGHDEMEAALARIEGALDNVLSDEVARWILDPRHDLTHNEWALTGVVEGRLVRAVIDRSFVDAQGVRWIIDYKTSEHEGGQLATFIQRETERHRDQLETYAALVAGYERRPIRLGLYFPLLRTEDDDGSGDPVAGALHFRRLQPVGEPGAAGGRITIAPL